MCEFISFIKKGKKIYFLDYDKIYNTEKGRLLQKETSKDDYIGHGAIRFYYGLEQDEGKNCECTDFSTPKNFPNEIVIAIKEGRFRGMATPGELLTQPALAEYEKVEQPAWAEYEKVRQTAFWDLFAIPENRNPEWR